MVNIFTVAVTICIKISELQDTIQWLKWIRATWAIKDYEIILKAKNTTLYIVKYCLRIHIKTVLNKSYLHAFEFLEAVLKRWSLKTCVGYFCEQRKHWKALGSWTSSASQLWAEAPILLDMAVYICRKTEKFPCATWIFFSCALSSSSLITAFSRVSAQCQIILLKLTGKIVINRSIKAPPQSPSPHIWQCCGYDHIPPSQTKRMLVSLYLQLAFRSVRYPWSVTVPNYFNGNFQK